MAREQNESNGRDGRSPAERYRDFARKNDDWDRKVKHSIEKIEKASRSGKRSERTISSN
ncbi:MAG TPA: hypothetical protein VF517_03750 [Thermoleophilaceae bacterium]|jgi:hypothetical protein